MLLPFLLFFSQNILQLGERSNIWENELERAMLHIVKSFTENTLGKFSKQDALLSCPSIGSSSVESALKKLVEEGAIIKTGAGRKTMYMRNIN